MKREKQLHFASIDSDWPAPTSTLVLENCRNIYQQALSFWQQFEVKIPQEVPEEPKLDDQFTVQNILSFRHKQVSISLFPNFAPTRSLRICDITIPQEFQRVLQAYVKNQPRGRKSELPATELISFLYEHHAIEKEEDIYNFLPIKDAYSSWSTNAQNQWLEQDPKFSGWTASFQQGPEADEFHLSFSPEGELTSLDIWRKHLINKTKAMYQYLQTRATFKELALSTFWHEEPNGILFPDPRGERETIWPRWIKTFQTSDKIPATHEDWDDYLNRIRQHQPVISGATGKRVLQTESQAKTNLEIARDMIYYSYPQVLSFKRLFRDPGFSGVLGYRARGAYGSYVVKNSTSFRTLSFSETTDLLASSTSQFEVNN